MTAGPAVPPGWPDGVHPPDTPGFERTAIAWLFDLCPPDYRGYEVLRKHPVVLAHIAANHVQAGIEATRRGLATVRHDLRAAVSPQTVGQAVEAYEREGARLLRVAREVDLVADALLGRRYVPRL